METGDHTWPAQAGRPLRSFRDNYSSDSTALPTQARLLIIFTENLILSWNKMELSRTLKFLVSSNTNDQQNIELEKENDSARISYNLEDTPMKC